MKELIKSFYTEIGNKKVFYIPLILLLTVGYTFSAYNRTVSWDDLLKDSYREAFWTSRWGMNIWTILLGITDLNPFVDRFVSVFFLCIGAVLTCCIFYYISNKRNEVIAYTVLASMFVSYPLMIEIWEYTGADVMVTGNIVLASLCLLYLLVNRKSIGFRHFLVATLLMLIPVSSYEVAIFFYVSFVCIIIFYHYYILKEEGCTLKKWISNLFYFAIPAVAAVILRYVVGFAIQLIFQMPYRNAGNTGLKWGVNDIYHDLIGENGIHYVIKGLVYFPITVFVLTTLVYVIVITFKSIKQKSAGMFALGAFIVISLFTQAILQCDLLPYRNAQTITLFLSFVFFEFTLWISSIRSSFLKNIVYGSILFLCWHQSVYVNKILSLNNLRYDNETSVIRNIGQRIISDYNKKTVVVVNPYENSKWINNRISVDETKWNGKLFYNIVNKIYSSMEYPHNARYVQSCVTSNSALYASLKNYFSYSGFDIDLIHPINTPGYKDRKADDLKLQLKALEISRETKMRPYEIKDMGEYIIVSLGNGEFPGYMFK